MKILCGNQRYADTTTSPSSYPMFLLTFFTCLEIMSAHPTILYKQIGRLL